MKVKYEDRLKQKLLAVKELNIYTNILEGAEKAEQLDLLIPIKKRES